MEPGGAAEDTPFQNGVATNGTHVDVLPQPPQPPQARVSQGLDLHSRKTSTLSRASSFCMPKQRVQYPDFPEFDLTSTEIAELEELLHR